MPYFSILKQFQDIIKETRVIQLEQVANLLRFRIILKFADDSILHIKEIKLPKNQRKYAYHWQDKNKKLLIRWDNSKHWKNISTHPHHKHVKTKKNVKNSYETTIVDVLTYIQKKMRK